MKAFILAMLMAFAVSVDVPASIMDDPTASQSRPLTIMEQMLVQGMTPEYANCVSLVALVVVGHYVNQTEVWTPEEFNYHMAHNIKVSCESRPA